MSSHRPGPVAAGGPLAPDGAPTGRRPTCDDFSSRRPAPSRSWPAGLGTATAQAAVPTASAAGAAGSAVTTRAVCGSPARGHASCFALQRTDSAARSANQRMNSALSAARAAGRAAAASTPSGLSPAQIQSAYRLSGLKSGGRTVAIVDAYHDPTAASRPRDLPQPVRAAGLQGQRLLQEGQPERPHRTTRRWTRGWAEEISLDLDMVSATCPDCKILLVEANSSSLRQPRRRRQHGGATGAKAISNSYGGSDLPDSSYGAPTTTPASPSPPSSGDSGYGAQFPADSKYVTAVGGTSLRTASNSRGWTETAWSGAGSGCSRYNTALAAASSFNTGCSRAPRPTCPPWPTRRREWPCTTAPSRRATPGWLVFGGTSASSPIIASVYALSGNTAGYANAIPYSHPSSLFDVTSGSNGTAASSSCAPPAPAGTARPASARRTASARSDGPVTPTGGSRGGRLRSSRPPRLSSSPQTLPCVVW